MTDFVPYDSGSTALSFELSKDALMKLLDNPQNTFTVNKGSITITSVTSGVSYRYAHNPSNDMYLCVGVEYSPTPSAVSQYVKLENLGKSYLEWQIMAQTYVAPPVYAPNYGYTTICQCADCKKVQEAAAKGESWLNPASYIGEYMGGGGYTYIAPSKDYIDGTTVSRELAKLFPDAVTTWFDSCPMLARGEKCIYGLTWGPSKWNVLDVVVHLNDKHKKTREEIADWLESLDVNLAADIPQNPEEDEKDIYNA
jgi:hypothetical protein